MVNISNKDKMELNELLVKWFRLYGNVAARRPYNNDDDDSGTGTAQLLFEGHPLFAELPIGATSDLDFIITADNRNLHEADKRSDEACPELRYQLEIALNNRHQLKFNPLYTPIQH
jgi:hypothetical protein